MEWVFDEHLPKDAVILCNNLPSDAYVAFFKIWIHPSYPSQCVRIDGITADGDMDPDLEMDLGL